MNKLIATIETEETKIAVAADKIAKIKETGIYESEGLTVDFTDGTCIEGAYSVTFKLDCASL